ncbi:MAG TPA: anthrone oxygenase family protein [Pseudogracilibacillus sp.]|nr:anthrone oxygenase family protein [Pseudogracilibacillus sp.]
MNELLFTIFLGLSILSTGVVAGTVFAYGNSVMPGLKHADDRTFVLSIRHLTSSVANPMFLMFSNGALVTQIGFVILAIILQKSNAVILGSVALVFYVATLLITFLGNLPLNKAIINADIPTNDSKWNELRVQFESRWTFWNHARTITCIISVSLIILALLIN